MNVQVSDEKKGTVSSY